MLRQLTHAGRTKGRGTSCRRQVGYQDMGGRVTRYPLRVDREDRAEHGSSRRAARRSLDGRDERRLFLPVSDRHAQRSACIRRRRWRSSCAGPTTAGSPRRCCRKPTAASTRCCACRSRIPTQALRQVETFGDRKGVTGFMVTTVRNMPVHDNAYMKVYRAIEERGLVARVPFRPELGRAGVQELQPLHLGARARLLLLQHPALHQLGHQRHGRALPEAAGDLDRGRPRLGAVPDAAARPRIHAAAVGMRRC